MCRPCVVAAPLALKHSDPVMVRPKLKSHSDSHQLACLVSVPASWCCPNLMAPKKKTRSRFAGSPQDLAACLMPHANSPGFIFYGEDRKKYKLNKRLVMGHEPIIKGLHSICSNLRFRKSTVMAALAIVAARQKWFQDDPDELDAWQGVATRRLRLICRHVSQACLKGRGKNATWIRLLLPSLPAVRKRPAAREAEVSTPKRPRKQEGRLQRQMQQQWDTPSSKGCHEQEQQQSGSQHSGEQQQTESEQGDADNAEESHEHDKSSAENSQADDDDDESEEEEKATTSLESDANGDVPSTQVDDLPPTQPSAASSMQDAQSRSESEQSAGKKIRTVRKAPPEEQEQQEEEADQQPKNADPEPSLEACLCMLAPGQSCSQRLSSVAHTPPCSVCAVSSVSMCTFPSQRPNGTAV